MRCKVAVLDTATPLCAVPTVPPSLVSLRGSSSASSTRACPGQGLRSRSGSRAPSTAGAWLMPPWAAAGAPPCSASPSVRGDIPTLCYPHPDGGRAHPCAWVGAAGRAGAEPGLLQQQQRHLLPVPPHFLGISPPCRLLQSPGELEWASQAPQQWLPPDHLLPRPGSLSVSPEQGWDSALHGPTGELP